ncbi:hypothetical protein CIK05_06090 [Bdellovibrio sp. qaytius]|nr:hypothetical protein CIK05_06090 [Bdellovibrio sp. qaytius]
MKHISMITLFISLFSIGAFAKMNMGSTFIEAKDLKWTAVAEFPGIQMAVVDGDSQKGSHHAMHKFDAGLTVPMHHHSAETYGTIIAGTIIITMDGIEHRLTPGSFFTYKRNQPHTTACAAGAECIMSLDVRGKWDVIPEKKLVTN